MHQVPAMIRAALGTWLCIITSPALLAVAASPPFPQPPAELSRWLQPQEWVRDAEGPIVALGKEGEFDDRHIFAPTVAEEEGKFWMWYCGSRGKPNERVFRLGLAMSRD